MSSNNHIDYSRKHDLTIEEIKSCEMFRNFSDEHAQEVIDTFKRLTEIVFEAYQCDKKVNNISRKKDKKKLS